MGLWTAAGVLLFLLGPVFIGCAVYQIISVNLAERFELHVRKKIVLAVAVFLLITIVLVVLWVVALFRVLENR
jgi:hypothetical protein